MIDNKAIFNISYGLFVLVARQGDKDNACIINVAQQVTSNPLQIAICVNKQNLTHDMVLHTLKFNLCPLSEEATMKPFQHFGFQSGKTVDKFAECEVELRTENGLRYLPKYINSVISCVVTKSIDLGTHTMFIAMPMEAKVLSDSPSITYAYYQQHIKPKPAATPDTTGKKKWVCEVCGYVYEGDEMPDDFVCPLCKHGKSDFKLMEKLPCRTMKHSHIRIITTLMGTLLMASCMMEKPTVKNYRKVLAMENLTPVTVEQLRQLIAADTTHYKVVVLTSSCCGYCGQAMRDVYPRKMAECDSSQVHWYFVEESYGTAQYMDEVFRQHNIDSPRYWINDTLPQYRPLMVKNMWTIVWNLIWHYGADIEELGWDVVGNRLDNIVAAIIPQPQPVSVSGVPTTLMLDPQGRMKCTYIIYNDSTAMLEPTDIRNITVPVTELEYTKVDTLSYAPKVCTPDGECP